MKDTHGNSLVGIGNLFAKNSYVKAILNISDKIAYLQNADTNGYLESKFAALTSALADGQLKFRIVDGELEYSIYSETAASIEEV